MLKKPIPHQNPERFITTEDGSPTIFDENFGEHHHSLIGAYTEARYKFTEVSRCIWSDRDSIKLLDLPFGLGYNFIAALEQCQLNDTFVECLAIEKERSVIKKIADFPANHSLKEYFDLLLPLAAGKRSISCEDFSLDLRVGDLLEILPEITGEFDLIFYDPFSPRVASALWSEESVLFHLHRLLSEDGMLATYTASPKVRKGLLNLGFKVGPSVAVGRKMPGTLASKRYPLKEEFSAEMKKRISRSKPYP